ncbi:MAG: hypothetical protein GY820_01015 [Gammaproteobacteria bacterium]|nr:hypothetical protein [Gammaproteobacteria bacterium]
MLRIVDQHARPAPTVRDYNALTTSNLFSMQFGSNLGEGINSFIIDRSNILNGVAELKASLANSGSRRLSMYVQGYDGPWGSYPMKAGLKMPKEHEARLRELQFSAPGRFGSPYAIFLVLVAMHGHVIMVRLTDFVFEDDTGYSKYRMKFPKELKAVLDSCYLIVWGWEAQLDLLDAAFEGDPDWSYTKPGGSIKTSVAADWSTLDIAVINRFSEFGKVRTTTAAEFYDTRKNRNLLTVLEGLINDPGLIEGYDNRAKS